MADPGEPLSEREHEIVTLVATGATNRMIAQQLSISPNTVKVHLRNIFTKLEISSRTEATVVAIREGWVEVDEGAAIGSGGLAVEGALAADAVEEEIVLSLAPVRLPWGKRFALLISAALMVILTVLTWPRPAALPAESCDNEFTADCAEGGNGSDLGEPESMWVNGAPLPEPRGRFALVALESSLYAIGGETAAGVTGSVVVYDLDADRWSASAAKPTPAANLAAVTLDGLIYAFGGSDEQGRPLNIVETYDPVADTWAVGPALPKALVAHGAAVVNGHIFVVGGYDGSGYVGQLFELDPADGRWQTLPDMPTPRGFAGVASQQNAIFVMGGYDGQREYAVCERFDLGESVWKTCAPMSTPRGGVRAVAVAGQVYVIGGGWQSFVTFSERYSPNSDAWVNVETPLLLAGGEWLNPGVAAMGTQIFAVGGWQGDRYLSLNQAFETLPNRLYLPATTGGSN